ncbi:2-phosphosulfolactate phosphatase [Brevibacillus fluminis]|uniref:Probable 2-phosphosulfolactate phosphatase n=1 Tax=Brevibacillus fluminis TaxID=511487 RepID=A0A3M8DYF0_9BACL|nr:2-phosphosulfolactate phosphatase [Brevibacillus fluminis]RNB92007.1 2-phosphosulfolactate phosphatase [Brevibacillus fluminis]
MFAQNGFDCKVEWGKRGAREAAERGDITIIVDVLSFSSTVVTAASMGAILYPFPPPINDAALAYAESIGAELMLGRAEAVRTGTPSLSPLSFGPQHQSNRFVLCSLNGAACTRIAAEVPALLVGCLLNATAVANQANRLQKLTGAAITVVACGEHWRDPQANENELRPAIEDYLGAGAILSKLTGSKSPEALVCLGAFQQAAPRLSELIWDCGSGRELRDSGFADDVRHCARLDVFDVVPLLNVDHFTLITH